MSFIVELEPGVWLLPGCGDPGRTLNKASARRYGRWQDAKCGLTHARKYRPFKNAKIEDVPRRQGNER